MAVYKVLQDIEAEDQFLGPLTLRQFIYASISAVGAYLSFIGFAKNIWLLPILLIPVVLFGGFLAWPWSKDQSNEVWLLAKIRFFLKPRRRIWNQSGMKDLVRITAPKKIERQLTDGLTQTEVRSRLQALANTIDSRGWAVKNVNINMFAQPSYLLSADTSDRLIDPTAMPQNVPSYDITAQDDILDEHTNPTAQHFSEMIAASEQMHRNQVVAKMKEPATQATAGSTPNYWFMNEAPTSNMPPGQSTFAVPTKMVSPGLQTSTNTSNVTTADEKALLEKIHHDQEQPDPTNYHMRTLEPVSENLKHHETRKKMTHTSPKQDRQTGGSTSTAPPDPAIIELANNDDLNVATIARQAGKTRSQSSGDEVVVSLR